MTLSRQQKLLVCANGFLCERTLKRYLDGKHVKPSSRERIEHTLKAMGIDVPDMPATTQATRNGGDNGAR